MKASSLSGLWATVIFIREHASTRPRPRPGRGKIPLAGRVTLSDIAIRLRNVTKAFEGHVAVDDVSLDVPRGSVYGLLGPNGAGKTTTLRMLMNILGADRGSIEILGSASDRFARDRVGYLPEERGLYPSMQLEEQLLYLAELKGASRADAKARLDQWLPKLGLGDWRARKTNELSKGMQQKAQVVVTLLHDPEILVLDEPFSGLDPVGADLLREVLLDLSRQGKTLVLSSHQMETVERLCDRVALINRGRLILDGRVSEVKQRHGHNTVVLAFDGDGSFLPELPEVAHLSDFGRYVELRLADGADSQSLLRAASERLRLSRFELVEPSLHSIFVEQVTADAGSEAGETDDRESGA
jgi:ABC-2 type transport system ATP-binding protein